VIQRHDTLVHGLTVVARNVDDFRPTGVAIVNPWDARRTNDRHLSHPGPRGGGSGERIATFPICGRFGFTQSISPDRLAMLIKKGTPNMKRLLLSLATVGAVVGVSAQALAGPVSGAVIGATGGAVVAGPPGAVVGAVAGAVIGGPNIHFYHHHRVYYEGRRHYYIEHHRRVYY
jgi:hypothetical protein